MINTDLHCKQETQKQDYNIFLRHSMKVFDGTGHENQHDNMLLTVGKSSSAQIQVMRRIVDIGYVHRLSLLTVNILLY